MCRGNAFTKLRSLFMGLGDLFGGGNVNKLLAKIDELKTELESARHQTQAVKEKAQGDKAEVKRIKKEVSDLRDSMRKEQEKVRSIKASKASLAERIEHGQVEIDGLKQKINQHKSDLEARLEELGRYQGMEAALEASQNAVADAKTDLKTVQAELKAIPSTTDLHFTVERLENKGQRLKEDVSLLRSRLKKAESERNTLRDEKRKSTILFEASIRDYKHQVEMNRRIYLMQEKELELARERANGAEQRMEILTREAIEKAYSEAEKKYEGDLKTQLTSALDQAKQLESQLKAERRLKLSELEVVASIVNEDVGEVQPSDMSEEDWAQAEAALDAEEQAVLNQLESEETPTPVLNIEAPAVEEEAPAVEEEETPASEE
jgi:outer membrane murein-binding lipoprotein Lpp